jgi:hypothetical protein
MKLIQQTQDGSLSRWLSDDYILEIINSQKTINSNGRLAKELKPFNSIILTMGVQIPKFMNQKCICFKLSFFSFASTLNIFASNHQTAFFKTVPPTNLQNPSKLHQKPQNYSPDPIPSIIAAARDSRDPHPFDHTTNHRQQSTNSPQKLTSSTWSNSLVSKNFSSSISSESRSMPSSSISASAAKV